MKLYVAVKPAMHCSVALGWTCSAEIEKRKPVEFLYPAVVPHGEPSRQRIQHERCCAGSCSTCSGQKSPPYRTCFSDFACSHFWCRKTSADFVEEAQTVDVRGQGHGFTVEPGLSPGQAVTV